jgi:lysyl-tRNA synthetase, class II
MSKISESVVLSGSKSENQSETESEQIQYSKLRDEDMKKLNSIGLPSYPHKFCPNLNNYGTDEKKYIYIDTTVEQFCNQYQDVLKPAEHAEDHFHGLIGRVYLIRRASKKLIFLDLHQEGRKIQIMVNAKFYLNGSNHYDVVTNVIRPGDIIGVAGFPAKTKTGELSLIPHRIEVLAVCKAMLPPRTRINEAGEEVSGLLNQETRYRQRYLDLIINEDNINIFIKRSRIIKALRNYLDNELKLFEVDTPVLNPSVGGAVAKPFETYSNDYSCPLFMRIAPELSLKQLIVGGFRGVYELGKQFRNESNDLTHNSEFTSLEFYIQNHDHNDLMTICENMLYTIVMTVNNSPIVTYDGKTIDFSPPFKRIDMLSTLESILGLEPMTLEFNNITADESREFLDNLCKTRSIECSHPRTTPRLLDKLVSHYIEPMCVNPTFITGHPQIMSPLAKWDRCGSCRTERFELFVNSTELANAYTELNDPMVQLELFKTQAKDKAMGDDEAMPVDNDFVKALEYGLCPTGGFGLGVDRFIMFLTGNTSIREIILFPTMKPIIDQNVTNT